MKTIFSVEKDNDGLFYIYKTKKLLFLKFKTKVPDSKLKNGARTAFIKGNTNEGCLHSLIKKYYKN